MDKKVVFSVAGSGKTRFIINKLSLEKRSLVVTYTDNNLNELRNRIIKKFGYFPNNIKLMSYFSFIHMFCFKPFLAYKYKTKGITFSPNPNRFAKKTDNSYFINRDKRVYSNRIAKFIKERGATDNVLKRLEKYFDDLFIDEIQDIAGHDFNFLKDIVKAKINIFLVGDFYQHTFDTSRDGSVNKNLHKEYLKYKNEFKKMNLDIDETSLEKSYRCGPEVCKFISTKLCIKINSMKTDKSVVLKITNSDEIRKIFNDGTIIKLFLKQHYNYCCYSKNWGESKGEDHYNHVCVVLNKGTMDYYKKDILHKLNPQTRNKLYVACTRAKENLFLISEEDLKKAISS